MGKRKTTPGQVTPVLNKFKNKNPIAKKLWLPETPFGTDKSWLGWSPYSMKATQVIKRWTLTFSSLSWTGNRGHKTPNIARTAVCPSYCFQHTNQSWPLRPSSTLFPMPSHRWEGEGREDEFTLKLTSVMDSVTFCKGTWREGQWWVNHWILSSLLDTPSRAANSLPFRFITTQCRC